MLTARTARADLAALDAPTADDPLAAIRHDVTRYVRTAHRYADITVAIFRATVNDLTVNDADRLTAAYTDARRHASAATYHAMLALDAAADRDVRAADAAARETLIARNRVRAAFNVADAIRRDA